MNETTEIDMVLLRDSDLELARADDDVRGMTAYDPYGHRLGEIDDIVIDEQERRARLLVVASGGILGLLESWRLVPVESVIRVDEVVVVDHDFTDDPTYDPDLVDGPTYADVYQRCGLPPFWSSGRVDSYFHRRQS